MTDRAAPITTIFALESSFGCGDLFGRQFFVVDHDGLWHRVVLVDVEYRRTGFVETLDGLRCHIDW